MSKNAAEQLVDPEKRDALANSLDLKTLFEYLNSSEDSALEIVLAAFYHRIEQDYQEKIAKDAEKASKENKDGAKTEENSNANDLLLPGSLLQQYLEKSPETNELWSILAMCLKRDKTKSVMATMLLFCFSSILKFTTWSHLQYLRSSIARTFTKSHIHMCGSNLSSEQPMLVNATLSLLTEIVHVSSFHARDLFSAFNWSQKSLFNLVGKKNASYEGRKNAKEGETKTSSSGGEYQRLYLLDVRTHYIQFGLSFLEHNDASLTQDVLAIPSFLSGVFKDMPYDATALILQTFETLHEHVLRHPSVSKTSKTHFFTSWILAQIAAVYRRFTVLKSPDEKLGALASLTRRRIQSFLESLLSSPTEGIVYLDVAQPFPTASRLLPANEELALGGTGSSGSNSSAMITSDHAHSSSGSSNASSNSTNTRNKAILKFIQLLVPQESTWHEKLVLKILDKDAQLSKAYFDSLRLSVEPRPTNAWINNVSYILKLLDVRPLDLEAIVSAATTNSSEISNFSFDRIASWFAPHCCLQRAYLSAGLRHPNISVRFVMVNLIQRILSVLDDLNAAFRAELALCPVDPESTLLYQLYEGLSNVFKRKVPDLDAILTLFNSIGGKVPEPAPSAPATSATAPNPAEINLDIEPEMLSTQIMQLMASYIRRFPESFVELNFDFGKLFALADPWNTAIRVQDGLLGTLEAAIPKLKWNAPLPGQQGQQKNAPKTTQLEWLLRFLITSSDESIRKRLLLVCRQILLASGLFDRCPTEIGIWLEMLLRFPTQSCAHYFEAALSYLALSPHFWADEMGRLVVASDHPDALKIWRQKSFPTSSALFPFSLLSLAIIKDHAHILVSALGGASGVDERMKDVKTWNELSEIAEFLNTAILHILLGSELPMPIILAIVSFGNQTSPLPSHDTGRGKNAPIPDALLQTPVFAHLFLNLRGFVHKVCSILPPDVQERGLGAELGLPILSPWTQAINSLHVSIFETGPIAEFFGLLPAQPNTPLAEIGEINWAELGAVHFICHIFSAPLRSTLALDERIKTLALSLMALPDAIVPSVRALLFFIGTFLEDENSGDCLHLALHLLSTIFTRSLQTMVKENSENISSKSSGDAENAEQFGEKSAENGTSENAESSGADASSVPSEASKASGERKSKRISATIFRLILGNPALNSHFLRDISSPSSIALNHIIAQLLEAVVSKSAHHLVSEVKEYAAQPLSKLATVFESLLTPKISPDIVHCIPLVRTVNCFMSPSVYQDIIRSILKVPAKKLLSEEGLPLFDLLVQMLLSSSSSRNMVFKLSVPCFRFTNTPSNVAHVVRQPLISETKQTPIFEAPPCNLPNFSALLQLHSYASTKASKLTGDTVPLVAMLDQIVFRLLISSFNAAILPADSLSSITALSQGDAETLALGDPNYVSQIGAPFLPPDFPLLVDAEFIESLLKSMRKVLESDESDSLAFLPMIHRAGICSLFPSQLLSSDASASSASFRKLLSTFTKEVEDCIGGADFATLKSKEVVEDLKTRNFENFFAKLESTLIAHNKHWFILILLHTYILHPERDEKLIAKAFKPFASVVAKTVFYANAVETLDHPTISPIAQLLLEFGAPVLRHVLSTDPKSIWKDSKHLEEIQKTFSEISAIKDYSLNQCQLDAMVVLFASKSPYKLVNQLVLQAAVLLQNIAKMKEEEQIEGTFQNEKLLDCIDLLHVVLRHLQDLIPEVLKMSEDDILKTFRRLLRNGYERSEILDFVFSVVQRDPSSRKRSELLSTLHDLLVSHSSFVKLLMERDNSGYDSSNANPSSSSSDGEFTVKRSNKGSLQRLSSQAQSKRGPYVARRAELEAKLSLLRLMCLVYDAEPESSQKFSPKMLALYMSAYHATLSPSDQLMLHIVLIFEKHEVNFSHAGFLWGSVAQEYAASSNSSKKITNADKNGNEMDVDSSDDDEDAAGEKKENGAIPPVELATFHALLLGGQLTPQRSMLTTIRSFSPYLKLATSVQFAGEGELFPFSPSQRLRARLSSLFDPRFLLLVYQFGMNFFGEFDCKKFIEVGGLALVFQTLSSFCPQLRSLGYNALATFSKILDKAGPGSSMRESSQIRLLLSVLRAAISVDNLLLAGPTVSFLSEISLLLIRVDHPLFLELHNYLLARPALPLTSVPILKRFLVSSRNAAKLERDWALRMMECGVRAPSDLKLLGMRSPADFAPQTSSNSDLQSTHHGSSQSNINNKTNSVASAANSTSSGKTDPYTMAALLTHLTSNMAASFAAVSERHRIWAILAKTIANDSPSYKNTLLGPGGLAPFLAVWTASHSLHNDRFAVLPTANISSPLVYAEVLIVLRAIVSLPEIATSITKSKSLWLQFQPIIYNILNFLQLSYAKIGSLRSGEGNSGLKNESDETSDQIALSQTSSNANRSQTNLFAIGGDSFDSNQEHSAINDSDLPSHAHNVYWRLLSPCIKLLYYFSSNSSIPMGVPTQMMTLAAKLLSHLVGSFRPVCTHHSSISRVENLNSSHHGKVSTSNNSVERGEKRCDCSIGQIEVAEHYNMLAHAIVHDKPDEFTDSSVNDWCSLTQLAMRIILLQSPSSEDTICVAERFNSMRMLLGQLNIVATTSKNPLLLQHLAKALTQRLSGAGTLLNALLFAYRQHAPSASSSDLSYRDLITIVLLNTLCTLITATALQSRENGWTQKIHSDWSKLISETLPRLLKSTRTLSANTLHEPTLIQFFESMTSEEKKSHAKLALLFRALLASDLELPPPSNFDSISS